MSAKELNRLLLWDWEKKKRLGKRKQPETTEEEKEKEQQDKTFLYALRYTRTPWTSEFDQFSPFCDIPIELLHAKSIPKKKRSDGWYFPVIGLKIPNLSKEEKKDDSKIYLQISCMFCAPQACIDPRKHAPYIQVLQIASSSKDDQFVFSIDVSPGQEKGGYLPIVPIRIHDNNSHKSQQAHAIHLLHFYYWFFLAVCLNEYHNVHPNRPRLFCFEQRILLQGDPLNVHLQTIKKMHDDDSFFFQKTFPLIHKLSSFPH